MPKINVNGIVREMTAEEITEIVRMADETPPVIQTPEQVRLDEIEAALIELAAMLAGGV